MKWYYMMVVAAMAVIASKTLLTTPGEYYKHDVYLSFEGEEVYSSFLCHLCGGLRKANVDFLVDEKLERGEKLTDGMAQAIRRSRISLIIFSAGFASSTRSLDKMVVAMKSHGFRRMVVPVFYRIEPSDVEFQNGTFEGSFIRHEDTYRCSRFKVQRWREYLKDASNLAGWVSKDFRSDVDLVREIVKDVNGKLERESINEYQLNPDIVRYSTRAIEYGVAIVHGYRRFLEEVAEI